MVGGVAGRPKSSTSLKWMSTVNGAVQSFLHKNGMMQKIANLHFVLRRSLSSAQQLQDCKCSNRALTHETRTPDDVFLTQRFVFFLYRILGCLSWPANGEKNAKSCVLKFFCPHVLVEVEVPPAVPGVDGPADVAAHGGAAGALEMEIGKRALSLYNHFEKYVLVSHLIGESICGRWCWCRSGRRCRPILVRARKKNCKTQFPSLIFIPDKFGRKYGRGMYSSLQVLTDDSLFLASKDQPFCSPSVGGREGGKS